MSALLALFASMLFDGGVRIGQATPKVWAIILYLALACTLTGYLLQNLALEKIPARAVSLIQCTCPVMTAVFSFLLLGERLAAVGMIGAVIILFCVAGESVFGSKP
jgi:drug/metabolite transporter (DMT)-like permease